MCGFDLLEEVTQFPPPPPPRMLFQRRRRHGVLGGRLLERGQAQLQTCPQLHLGDGRGLSDRSGQNPRGRGPVRQRRSHGVQPEHALDPPGAAARHQLAAVRRRTDQDRCRESFFFFFIYLILVGTKMFLRICFKSPNFLSLIHFSTIIQLECRIIRIQDRSVLFSQKWIE